MIIYSVIEPLIHFIILAQSLLHHMDCPTITKVSFKIVKVQRKDFKSEKLLRSVTLTATFITILVVINKLPLDVTEWNLAAHSFVILL